MHIQSNLPFPALTFKHWRDDREIGVVLMKATFEVTHAAPARYLADQPEILMQDLFRGEPNQSSLLQESELVPFKPTTDITLNATARTLEEKPLTDWRVRISIPDRLSYEFTVTGNRLWEYKKGWRGGKWALSAPEPTIELPICYEYAYGGHVINPDNEEENITHPYNPVGRGLLPAFLQQSGQAVPAPQIVSCADFMSMADNPEQELNVFGLSPLTKSWLPRRRLAGTLDERWRQQIHPKMPDDYDLRYWNGAPASLQVDGYLKGNEIIHLEGVSSTLPVYRIRLPDAGIACRLLRSDNNTETTNMLLDTVHIDISDQDTNKHWISLVWRTNFNEPDTVQEIIMQGTELENTNES